MAFMLAGLMEKYSGAPYAYFRITNYDEARRAFLSGEVEQPVFTYPARLQQDRMEARLASCRNDLAAAQNENEAEPEVLDFLQRRMRETLAMLAFLRLQRQPHDEDLLEGYRDAMSRLYGDFDTATRRGVLGYLRDRAEVTGNQALYQEVIAQLAPTAETAHLYAPSTETFNYYRKLLLGSDHVVATLATMPAPANWLDRDAIIRQFERALEVAGAAQEGWTVRSSANGANVMVLRQRKIVLVGKYYEPLNRSRLQRVVAHEVGVHVQRSLLHVLHQSDVAEEGVAVMVEQLLGQTYRASRTLRYIAAALAWGADGRSRTFRETHELLWRSYTIVGGHDDVTAKRLAFRECARVFRGGIPEVAGAAYVKDKVYLESNLAVWRLLSKKRLSQGEFLQLINGYEDKEVV